MVNWWDTEVIKLHLLLNQINEAVTLCMMPMPLLDMYMLNTNMGNTSTDFLGFLNYPYFCFPISTLKFYILPTIKTAWLSCLGCHKILFIALYIKCLIASYMHMVCVPLVCELIKVNSNIWFSFFSMCLVLNLTHGKCSITES